MNFNEKEKSAQIPAGYMYNPFHVYCRELAPGTVSLTGDRAQGDVSKHDSHYKYPNHTRWFIHVFCLFVSVYALCPSQQIFTLVEVKKQQTIFY